MNIRSERAIAGWDVLFVIALIAAIVGSWLALANRTVSRRSSVRATSTIQSVKASARLLEKENADRKASIERQTWNVTSETLASEVLAKVSAAASAHGLEVAGFRAGRIIAAEGLQEITFSAILDGKFLDVMSAMEELEAPTSKMALSQLRISAKNQLDEVTATIGMTGFLSKEID